MEYLTNYLKNNKKVIIFILLIVVVLVSLTIINQNVLNGTLLYEEYLYRNDLATKVDNADYDNINYELIDKDLTDIENILKEQISLNLNNNKIVEYYAVANNIYIEKFKEITIVLTHKLDSETYSRYQMELKDFDDYLQFNIEDLRNKYISTVDYKFYKNKFLYEEKQKKIREILEEYKSFLQ